MAALEDRIQALMDEFYNEWQKEENNGKSKWDVLGGFSTAHQIAVTFGNFNYQVGNGGISQWIYNGYFHDDAEKFTEYLEIGAASDERCRTILDRVYKLDQYAQETDCDREGYFNDEDGESSFIGDMIDCDTFDTWYYDKCDDDNWWQIVCGIIDKFEERDMKHITTDELKRVTTEGLVLQGCGGNPQEWLNGVNEMLTEAGILLDGDTFKDISVFEHEGHTNILFNMEDVKLDIGKLAMWRLQTHGNFGGTWLSDYLPNRLGVEMENAEPAETAAPELDSEHSAPILPKSVSTSENKLHVLSACFDSPDEEHSGWWLGFPTTTESVQYVLKELGIYSGDVIANRHESGIKHLADCLSAIMQPDNIDELNYLAAKLNVLSVSQAEILEAALESRRHCDSVADIINLTENLDHFDLQPAYSAEQYGEFLVEMERDNTSEIFQRLENSSDPDEQSFAKYILRLEACVDNKAYGRAAAEEERGSFTQHGYLTESEGYKEVYRGTQDIPAEYRVFAFPEPMQYAKAETADLAAFVYKIHALAGDYMADAHFNVSTLANGSEHFLMLMNGKSIYICEADSAYHRDATANDIWFHQAVTPDTKAFALHITNRNSDRLSGSITEIDHAEQRQDTIEHGIGCMYIDAILKDGTERTYTPEEWNALEPIDRDRVQSWGRHYDIDNVDGLILHLEELTSRREVSAKRVPPEMILEDLNRSFTEKAVADRPEIFRVAAAAAKEIIARGDAPVYRLLPDKDELLTPLDVVRHGLNYSEYRSFAVKSEDIGGFLKWTERGVSDTVRRAANRDEREKPKSNEQEH